LLYSAGAHRAPWLPESARHRVVIWRHTSDLVPQAPLFGAGIGTARALNDAQGADRRLAPGTPFVLSTSLHSHNAYLQVWYEAGAVGAALLLGVGLLVLGSFRRYPAEVQSYIAATFVTGA